MYSICIIVVKKLLWVKFTLFLGIAIALAHDGKTRQELASELTHLEENSEKSQEAEATVESASVAVEKTVTLLDVYETTVFMISTLISE